MFSAHDGRLAALTFSPAGDQIATASEKVCMIPILLCQLQSYFILTTADKYYIVIYFRGYFQT